MPRPDSTERHGPAPGPLLPSGITLLHSLAIDAAETSQVEWSSEGRTLAWVVNDAMIQLWDCESGAFRPLRGTVGNVQGIAWSPDPRYLASVSSDTSVRVWEVATGIVQRSMRGHRGAVVSVAWAPDGRTLATGASDKTVRLWGMPAGTQACSLEGHFDSVSSLAWAPDGHCLASATRDRTVCLWDGPGGRLLRRLRGHADNVQALAWSPDSVLLAAAFRDGSVRVWNVRERGAVHVLEGHTGPVSAVAFSPDGKLLASKSQDHTIRLWAAGTWEALAVVDAAAGPSGRGGLAFHPTHPWLAAPGPGGAGVRVYEYDDAVLLGARPATPSVHYTNAKVVLLGDTSVGKSGLALVLTGKPFAATESTHGRHVWTFHAEAVDAPDGRQESRETLLWDLAGQPGYRLIHQLHLNEVAVALVLFDSRSETDPFAGVRHWDRALRQSRRLAGDAAPPLIKFLVAARTDRGGVGVSPARIKTLVRELGFDAYFETSAKEGRNIEPMAQAIRAAVDWDALPKVSSTELFQRIKTFLLEEKKTGRLLSATPDLLHNFLRYSHVSTVTDELRAQFETCIGLVESSGLIRRLGFGNFVLLQPELLDAYASAIVNAAKEEPDGLGCLAEEDALEGRFRIPEDVRIKDKEQERLLLIATVKDLLRHEIALRELADEGAYLVFPSQFTREHPGLPQEQGKEVIFSFEGPVMNVYATLAVRLSHSGHFTKKDMWKNAATFRARLGWTCGLHLREIEEGCGDLTLFFEPTTSEETRLQFEEYVHAHLQRRALAESIKRRRVFACPQCGEAITDRQAQARRERGFRSIDCPVCDTNISLLDREERLRSEGVAAVETMDAEADARREQETAGAVMRGKEATGNFDVFLCHNASDKVAVKRIGEELRRRGVLPWLDEWELPPGKPWQPLIERQINAVPAVVVFIGPSGVGPTQRHEIDVFLCEYRERGCRIIPALLAEVTRQPEVPPFLKSLTWVDFRKAEPDPVEQLVWGITGERAPGSS
jgi:GTPase SAR1 family protein